MDDDLLPHRAAEPVGEVVHLVHDDATEAPQRRRPGVQHVAQHLGRHDDDRGLAVEGDVTGEQADLVGAVDGGQLAVLLVGERLDRCRVEGLPALSHGQVHPELAHDRLARPRRRRDQHTAAGLERPARPER